MTEPIGRRHRRRRRPPRRRQPAAQFGDDMLSKLSQPKLLVGAGALLMVLGEPSSAWSRVTTASASLPSASRRSP